MADPQVLINDVWINDGVSTRLNWRRSKGLFRPAVRSEAAERQTADGPVAFAPPARAFGSNAITLAGEIVSKSTFLLARRALQNLAKSIDRAGSKSRLQIGSLYQEGYFHQAEDADTPYMLLPDKSSFEIAGKLTPGTWQCLYGYQVGLAQGFPVCDDRRDRTELLYTDISGNGRYFALTNPGSAPVYASLLISCTGGAFTADYTIYLRSTSALAPFWLALRMIKAATGKAASRVKRTNGLLLLPGTTCIRVEDSTGALDTSGSYQVAFATDQVFAYRGNDANKFNESLVIPRFYRRAGAVYQSAASGTVVSSAGDMVPRVGVLWSAYTAAKAGLVLEGASTNILLRNEELSHAAWSQDGTPTIAATTAPNGANTAFSIEDNNVPAAAIERIYQQVSVAPDTSQWCGSVYVKKAAAPVSVIPEMYVAYNGGADIGLQIDPYTGGLGLQPGTGSGWQYGVVDCGTWWRLWASKANNGVIASMWMYLQPAFTGSLNGAADVTVTGTAIWWRPQIENQPFPSSPIATAGASASRQADYAAAHLPHNYLKYSHDLTQIATTDTGKWIKSASGITIARTQTAADGTCTGSLITWTAVNDYLYQPVTPDGRPNSAAWTLVAALRLGNMAGSDACQLRIEDSAGTLIGSATTISAADLSASETRTFSATVTAAQVGATVTGLRATLKVTAITSTNGPVVEALALTQGAFPALPLHTDSEIVPMPAGGMQWPGFATQNGYIEFDAVLPPISTGKTYFIFGEIDTQAIVLYRHTATGVASNVLYVARASNGGIKSAAVDVGAVWDGAPHTFRLEWLNFTRAGTQYMYLRLYVDGVLKSTDSNLVTASTTEWSSDERLWISKGDVFATFRGSALGNPFIGLPAWTQGDIPPLGT